MGPATCSSGFYREPGNRLDSDRPDMRVAAAHMAGKRAASIKGQSNIRDMDQWIGTATAAPPEAAHAQSRLMARLPASMAKDPDVGGDDSPRCWRGDIHRERCFVDLVAVELPGRVPEPGLISGRRFAGRTLLCGS